MSNGTLEPPRVRPPQGAITAAATRLNINRSRLSAYVNGRKEASTADAVRFMSDHELGPHTTLKHWTGAQIPVGFALGDGLYALPGRPGPDGFVIPMPEPVHPGQLEMPSSQSPEHGGDTA